jgi:hypothetical protein
MFEDRQYIIFPVEYLSMVDFNEVIETSPETLRYSIDGTLTFIKWEGNNEPSCVSSIPMKYGPCDHSEMLEITKGPVWSEVIS